MEDAELSTDAGIEWLALHGARAAELATKMRERHGGASAELAWTSAGGALLAVPTRALAACRADLESDGAVLLSLDEWDPERIRLGLPRFGVDYGGSDNPHEAGLERRVVSWTKGCYLGQEVVCMQDMRGKVKRRLVRLALGPSSAPTASSAAPPGEVLDDHGAAVGTIKSMAGGFAIASVKAPAYESGAVVQVEGQPATVLALLD
jgi:folate-binding protein YgfZ